MIVKNISFASIEENIRYDEDLLKRAEKGLGGEILRFWETADISIVLGRACREEPEINGKEAAEDGVKIVRRMSGGGTVLQGPGCLNYSLVLSFEKRPELKDIKRSYRLILKRICGAFGRIGIKAEFEPVSDMALGGKKFSGSAQWRQKRYMLHHGTVLYDFPIEKIERYLKMPPAEPLYRKGRSHGEFLRNIGVKAAEIRRAIGREWEK